jgi:hypothetical protein
MPLPIKNIDKMHILYNALYRNPLMPCLKYASNFFINVFKLKRAPKKGKNQWHLWAGFCFFRLSCLQNVKIDFTHSVELRMDTGGSNWNSLYKYIKPEEVKCIVSDAVPEGELFSQMGNTIDNRFLHIGGASYRSKNFDKDNLMQALKEIALQNGPA